MPIYEYQCTSCHHHFDLMQKINEEPATQCPQCFQNTVVKLVSAAGFQLKGTGWYATDFKNKGNPVKDSSDNNKSDSTKTADTVTKDSAAPKTTDTTNSTKGTTE